MRRFYFPTQDASIYEEFTTRQAGLDEILEVGKTNEGRYSIRSLLQFDIEDISSSLSDGTLPSNTEFELKLYLARAERAEIDQGIYLYPISQSWTEGQGYFYEEPFEEDNEVTWRYKSSGSRWDASGSDYLSVSESYQLVANPISDVLFDVNDAVQMWVSGGFSNYGFLAKFPEADESEIGRAHV